MCKKSFQNQSNLNRHKCESFGISFSGAQHLKKHIHTVGEGHKDHKCDTEAASTRFRSSTSTMPKSQSKTSGIGSKGARSITATPPPSSGSTTSSASGGRGGSRRALNTSITTTSTSNEDEDDPYAFKEPEILNDPIIITPVSASKSDKNTNKKAASDSVSTDSSCSESETNDA